MSDLRNCPRRFLSEFIDLYKSYPCLWKVKSPEYNNKVLKRTAYDILKRKLREVDSDATRDTVIRKIDSLRGSFRKELKKVILSQKDNTDNIYQPRLWYYDKLLFLVNQEQEASVEDATINELQLNHKFEIVNVDEESGSRTPSPTRSSPSSMYSNTNVRKRKKSYDIIDLENYPEKLIPVEDEFDVIGRNVAHKLRSFPKEIKIVAEKLLNDIFFECEMGNVNKYTRLKLYQETSTLINTTTDEENKVSSRL